MSADRTTEEGQRLRSLAKRGTVEEFRTLYRPADATDSDLGPGLLFDALAQKVPANRPIIAGMLLDDGADAGWEQPGGVTTLHVLLGQNKHDFAAETPLLRRLLDAGADLNRVSSRHGTPLETIGKVFKFSEPEIAPFLDEIFDRDDLDLIKVSADGRTVLDNIRLYPRRPDLVARAEAYVKERGIDL